MAVSDKPWSQFSESDYTAQEFCRAALINLNDGSPSDWSKAKCKLPVKEPGGAINRNGVFAAAVRINQVDAPPEEKRAAARKLISIYRNDLDQDPPENLRRLAAS